MWSDDYDPTGDRVAIVGTGASSIQIVPEIASKVQRLTVFQRTPGWVLPKPDWTHSRFARSVIRHLPGAQPPMRGIQWVATEIFLKSIYMPRFSKAFVVGRYNVRRSIKDPAMRQALRPDYILGCKRGLRSNTYYPASARDNVEFACGHVGGPWIHGDRADGSERDVETLILGTGFNAVNGPIYKLIRGRTGTLSVTGGTARR